MGLRDRTLKIDSVGSAMSPLVDGWLDLGMTDVVGRSATRFTITADLGAQPSLNSVYDYVSDLRGAWTLAYSVSLDLPGWPESEGPERTEDLLCTGIRMNSRVEIDLAGAARSTAGVAISATYLFERIVRTTLKWQLQSADVRDEKYDQARRMLVAATHKEPSQPSENEKIGVIVANDIADEIADEFGRDSGVRAYLRLSETVTPLVLIARWAFTRLSDT
jgi:hypothetical protein